MTLFNVLVRVTFEYSISYESFPLSLPSIHCLLKDFSPESNMKSSIKKKKPSVIPENLHRRQIMYVSRRINLCI